ncbi:hypothetical protein GIB67_005758 [Kingdonia uniflora]|uniref:Major facilitator superfamily (MFS) profile domain-containing protein n=1 Tax=Kingdonia uniflora TaxID=39325 RepID=A0A7J7KVH7_9MAGN|nr:hypothetical protein GIB67_005758 [Kingdonia uniflora]
MAGGVVFNSGSPGKQYSGGMTFYVFWAILVAACGGLIFGYDIGISGGVTSMAPFLKKFFPKIYEQENDAHNSNQYCTFNNIKLTLFTSSLYLAALLASLVASYATRKFGRKLSMFFGGLVFFAGAAVNGFAMNVFMLIIGRLLLGVGIGFANQSVPLYLSEMAPYKHRGRLNILFQLMITLGILMANLVNYGSDKIKGGWGWRLSLALAAVPAVIITVGSTFLPNTPNSILERNLNHRDQAKAMLKNIRGTDDVEEEFKDLVAASEASSLVTDPWSRLLWEKKYRPHLTMAILIPFFQQLTGMNVVMFYAPVLFRTLGFGNDAALASAVITGGVNVLATFVSMWLVDKKGRRFLLIEGAIQMGVFQFLVGSLIAYKFGLAGVAVISKPYAIVVVFCVCAFVSGFAWSWGPLGWLVPSEIFPLEVRSAAQSITVGVNMFFTFVIAQIFLPMLCTMKFGLFYFFGCFTIIMTFFIYYFLPETKGVPIEEMWNVWKQHKFWSKYIPDDVIEMGKPRRPDDI